MEFTYSQVESLNETETYVYNYVVKNTKKVLSESIRELANDTHVSTATVMRFCKKMGCEGFTELKYRLKENVEVQKTKEDDVNDQFDDFIEKVKSSDYKENHTLCVWSKKTFRDGEKKTSNDIIKVAGNRKNYNQRRTLNER